jgi:hypothetical protein
MNILKRIVLSVILLFLLSAIINGIISGIKNSRENFKEDKSMEEKDTQSTKRPKIIVDQFDGKYQNEAGAVWEINNKRIILYLVGAKDMGIEYTENLISEDIQGDIKILKLKYKDSDLSGNDVTLIINKHTENLIEHDERNIYPDQIFKKK